MDNNSPWVPQENGTFLPSAELVQRVREKPDQFPNAVEDFTAISGLPREQVEAILNNQLRPGGAADWGILNAPHRATGAIVEGIGDAAGWAAEKLGLSGDNETVADATDFDPAFETEESTGEKVAEVVGQAAPAVAGAAAAGGAVPAAIVGAGISTLTFSDEDNLANLANDYVDGAVPDFLVVDPEDAPEIASAKSFASNLIVDLALAGAGSAIAKVYRAFKETPNGFVDMTTLKQIGEEAGVPLRETPVPATETAHKAVRDVAQKAADDLPKAVEAPQVRKVAAREKVAQEVILKETGQDIIQDVPNVPEDVAQLWRQDTLAPVQRLLNRSKDVNVGKRAGIKTFEEGPRYAEFVQHSEQVLKAIAGNNADEAVQLIRKIDEMPEATTIGHDYKTAVLKASLEKLDDNFMSIIERIRQDPSIKTKTAWKDLAADYHANKVKLAEMYREIGSSSAYAFLTRKGVKFSDEVLKPLKEAEADLLKELKDNGYTLFSSKAEFVAGNLMNLKELGYDPLVILDDLYKMFDEFDAARAGVLDNLQSNRLAKMSKAEREQMENSFIRWLNDMRSSAMLGQISTAALEATSNLANNALLPFTQHALRGDLKRAAREYAGYAASVGRTWDIFKKAALRSKSVVDDFDSLDGNHVLSKDYDTLARDGKWGRYVFYRLWDGASSLAIASSDSMKAMRATGLAYADGLEMALKQGVGRPEAKRMAREYVESIFDADGKIVDPAIRLDVQSSSWQTIFDTRYGTGKMAQFIENGRQHPNPLVNGLTNFAVPFWRTLINIGSHSAQTIQPIPATILKPLAKTPYAGKIPKIAKFLDDFTGANGEIAKQRAIGRQRLGYMTMAAAWAAMEADLIDITGPSGYRSWDAKIEEMRTYPGSSLFINGHAVDLTRMLPFSAPLLLLGVMKDMKREQALQMKDGNYVSEEDSAFNVASRYGAALGVMTYSLLSDAAAFRGVGDLWDSLAKAMQEGDVRAVVSLAEDYAKSFTPGLVRMSGKNQGFATGDWTQHEAEGFLNEALASAGWHTGYTRLDWLGQPVVDPGRGLDPFNTKPLKTDDPLYAEYVLLNKTADLGLRLDRPDRVFDKSFWKDLGVVASGTDWLFGTETPSLTQLKTRDGANAWERYRDLVYNGKASGDLDVNLGGSLGHVTIKSGETFEAALRRITEAPGYQNLTPEARKTVFQKVFGKFTKNAREYLKANLVIDPSLFQDSRYGSPISAPSTLGDTEDAGKTLAANVNRSRGLPLDDIFSIK